MTHQMTLLSEDEEGWKEFLCETCGRWLLIRFNPYGRAVIASGDETAAHRGGIGPVVMSGMEIVLGAP